MAAGSRCILAVFTSGPRLEGLDASRGELPRSTLPGRLQQIGVDAPAKVRDVGRGDASNDALGGCRDELREREQVRVRRLGIFFSLMSTPDSLVQMS
jgi:hypothetical protein